MKESAELRMEVIDLRNEETLTYGDTGCPNVQELDDECSGLKI